ncbi:MAG: hypothetical protein WA705_10510 [Candidatus Ozemobacteraceae bacterium]
MSGQNARLFFRSKGVGILLILAFLLVVSSPEAQACDPFSRPEVLFSLSLDIPFHPAFVSLAILLGIQTGLDLRVCRFEHLGHWADGESSALSPVDMNVFVFAAALNRGFQPASSEPYIGRARLLPEPITVILQRDSLRTGAWQNLILNVTFPGRGRFCLYRPPEDLLFVDEIDAGVTMSLVCSWPPVLMKHLRFFGKNGMIREWGEDEPIPEGNTWSGTK